MADRDEHLHQVLDGYAKFLRITKPRTRYDWCLSSAKFLSPARRASDQPRPFVPARRVVGILYRGDNSEVVGSVWEAAEGGWVRGRGGW